MSKSLGKSVSSSRLRFTISQASAAHILSGDSTGGGHRSGAGKGKSEFPALWTDQEILTAIEDIANDTHAISTRARMGRLKIRGVRKGVTVTVIVNPASWAIITGYPR